MCAEFGISRKTSYKVFERYKDCGVAALAHRLVSPPRAQAAFVFVVVPSVCWLVGGASIAAAAAAANARAG